MMRFTRNSLIQIPVGPPEEARPVNQNQDEEPEHERGSFTSSPVAGERNRWADDGPSGRMMDYMHFFVLPAPGNTKKENENEKGPLGRDAASSRSVLRASTRPDFIERGMEGGNEREKKRERDSGRNTGRPTGGQASGLQPRTLARRSLINTFT
ncbi:hypothetical protein EYF80_056458 [Liparis tanakae]|uniref:Uncharacterized protein n=1 Tax=Liparis tanakae TaxID=230148 RepID=A0A4Z2EXP2_9TELE|nr:hypothetical protein EYF80_056458 [Liparis tanakae]